MQDGVQMTKEGKGDGKTSLLLEKVEPQIVGKYGWSCCISPNLTSQVMDKAGKFIENETEKKAEKMGKWKNPTRVAKMIIASVPKAFLTMREEKFMIALNLDKEKVLHIPIEMTTNEEGISVFDLMMGKFPSISHSKADN